MIKQRIKHSLLRKKIIPDSDISPELYKKWGFKEDMNLGLSGFTGISYPKLTPNRLLQLIQNGEMDHFRLNLFAGASIGNIEEKMAEAEIIKARWPFQSSRTLAKQINSGTVQFQDVGLSSFASRFSQGYYTTIEGRHGSGLDVGIVEGTEITEDGEIVLSGGVGISAEVVKHCKKLIIEINTTVPSYKGWHDIVENVPAPHSNLPLYMNVDDRLGSEVLHVDPNKVVAVIVNDRWPDSGAQCKPIKQAHSDIADLIIDFLLQERKAGRLPEKMLPLQSGVGSIANAVMARLSESPFQQLDMWTEVAQDTILDLIDTETIRHCSTCALSFSPEGSRRFYADFERYKKHFTLRPVHITNNPALIRSLGVISLNTPIEVDIYGHANSTLICGSKLVHGMGGSNDFWKNSSLSICHTPSIRPTRTDSRGISTIVPKVSHVDHNECDIDVIVTEQGLADMRGLSPTERAGVLIDNCVHPDYKEQIREYFNQSRNICEAEARGHEPILLDHCFRMHSNLLKNGTMKLDWEFEKKT